MTKVSNQTLILREARKHGGITTPQAVIAIQMVGRKASVGTASAAICTLVSKGYLRKTSEQKGRYTWYGPTSKAGEPTGSYHQQPASRKHKASPPPAKTPTTETPSPSLGSINQLEADLDRFAQQLDDFTTSLRGVKDSVERIYDIADELRRMFE